MVCLHTGFADRAARMRTARPTPEQVAHGPAPALDGRDQTLLRLDHRQRAVGALIADNFAVERFPAREPAGCCAGGAAARALPVQARHPPRRALAPDAARRLAARQRPQPLPAHRPAAAPARRRRARRRRRSRRCERAADSTHFRPRPRIAMATYESTYDPASAPKDLEHLLYEKKGNVAYVTINRPEVRNALHTYRLPGAARLLARHPERPEHLCRRSSPAPAPAFCAGRDVKFLAKHQAEGKRTPHEDPNRPVFHWGGGGQPQDVNLYKPLICALNGFAVGVGLSIALQCQLRVMADDAWIGDQHTNVGRLGSPHEIYHELPRATAAYLTLCNGRLTAQECLQQGIVNKVAPKEQLMAEAEKLAAMVCAGSPLAVQAAVRLYRLTSAFPATTVALARDLDQQIAESRGRRRRRARLSRKSASRSGSCADGHPLRAGGRSPILESIHAVGPVLHGAECRNRGRIMRILAGGLRYPEGPGRDGRRLGAARRDRARDPDPGDAGRPGRGRRRWPGGPNGAAIGPGRPRLRLQQRRLRLASRGGHPAAGDSRATIAAAASSASTSAPARSSALRRAAATTAQGPNDLVFDRARRLLVHRPRQAPRARHRPRLVYWAKADGSEIREVVGRSSAERHRPVAGRPAALYVAETDTGRLWSWEIKAPGEVAQPAWPSPHGGTLVAGFGGFARFDSLAVAAVGQHLRRRAPRCACSRSRRTASRPAPGVPECASPILLRRARPAHCVRHARSPRRAHRPRLA